jgi:hypothetical protein
LTIIDDTNHGDTMSEEVQLTEIGLQTLREPDGVQADHVLFLEILARIGGVGDDENIDALTDQLIARFGSAEAAIVAVKRNQVRFQMAN